MNNNCQHINLEMIWDGRIMCEDCRKLFTLKWKIFKDGFVLPYVPEFIGIQTEEVKEENIKKGRRILFP